MMKLVNAALWRMTDDELRKPNVDIIWLYRTLKQFVIEKYIDTGLNKQIGNEMVGFCKSICSIRETYIWADDVLTKGIEIDEADSDKMKLIYEYRGAPGRIISNNERKGIRAGYLANLHRQLITDFHFHTESHLKHLYHVAGLGSLRASDLAKLFTSFQKQTTFNLSKTNKEIIDCFRFLRNSFHNRFVMKKKHDFSHYGLGMVKKDGIAKVWSFEHTELAIKEIGIILKHLYFNDDNSPRLLL